MLGALVCASGAATAQAQSGPRKPALVSGAAQNTQGLYTTGASEAVVELPSRARLRIAPNSAVRVFGVAQLLALTPGPRTWTWSLALQSGRVDVELPKAGRNAVLASMTSKFSAFVTAGHAAFRVEDGEATVVNQEGEMRTLLNDHFQTVPVGWQATLSKEDPSAVAKPGLPGPVLTSGQRMWFAPNESVAMHGYRWAAVPGATRYELRVRHLPDGKVLDTRGTTGTELTEALTPVEAGRYSLALRSVDARGIEGSWTPEAEVRVIGVVLPPGGYTTEQAIYLGAGQQVQFTNTEGLEMTYLGAGRYFPAVQGAGLYRNQKTVIGFRMPGVLDTAVARLEPRGLYADVRIGPQRALWPRESDFDRHPAQVEDGRRDPVVPAGGADGDARTRSGGRQLHARRQHLAHRGAAQRQAGSVDLARRCGGSIRGRARPRFLGDRRSSRGKKPPAVQIVPPTSPAAAPSTRATASRPAAEPPVASSN